MEHIYEGGAVVVICVGFLMPRFSQPVYMATLVAAQSFIASFSLDAMQVYIHGLPQQQDVLEIQNASRPTYCNGRCPPTARQYTHASTHIFL